MTDKLLEEVERALAVAPKLARQNWPFISLSAPEQLAAIDAHRRLMGLEPSVCPHCGGDLGRPRAPRPAP